jgi:hypothetical protein
LWITLFVAFVLLLFAAPMLSWRRRSSLIWRGEAAMSYGSAFTIIGWATILLGVNLLIVFGMPFRVRAGLAVWFQPDRAEGWFDVLGLLGLALIVLGTAAQIEAILLS